MKKVYSVEGVEFRSKKALEDFAREILKKDTVGSLLEGFDLDFMLSYFSQFHCEWITKKGVGVKALRRIKEPRYGKYRAFQLLRTDDTSTDISFILSNIGVPNYEQWFAQALRNQIEYGLVDEDLKNRFYAYHEQFAKLRMLHFEANLRMRF